ncbi:MAG: transketolase [Pseudomonadota bacterium]
MDLMSLKSQHPEHFRMAAALRFLAADAVHAAASGHQGMPIGMADAALVLFRDHLKFDAAAPDWPDRDRFILSAGHGSMLLYGLLHLTGYSDMTRDQIRGFRQWGMKTAGHPEYGHAQGIETTTGPLGQGIANSVGFAIAEQALAARFGGDLVDHHTYVIAGDGCLMEGVSHEAITLAGAQKLAKLIVLWDNNNITIDGEVSITDRTNQVRRFKAAGWSVWEVDGHDPAAIHAALSEARKSKLPSMIACKTNIALGVDGVQDTAKGHGYAIKDDQLAQMRAAYDWAHGPFEVPADVADAWAAIGRQGAEARAAWEARLAEKPSQRQREFARVFAREPSKKLTGAIRKLKQETSETAPKLATRVSSQKALEVINPIMREMIGGSADLTGSNNTLTDGLGTFKPGARKGRHIHYGIREHGMAAAMNGMALHGGVRPYGGTFMCFTDYARPAMRLSALMGVPTVYVMTHDSIGLGEDGPTHQPVEHLAISRATPNTLVFRPADTVETAESWELAVSQTATPSVLSLTRQGVPTVRTTHNRRNLTAQGAYILADSDGKRQAILMATGSEVHLALEAREILQAKGIGTRVVSMPCWELFETQPDRYRRKVLPGGPVRVGIEAAVRQGWDRWLCGERGNANKAAFVGMAGFGGSAPAERLYSEFGITTEAAVAAVEALLG